MRRLLLALCSLTACRAGAPDRQAGADTLPERTLTTAPVIRGPSVVAFWLASADTLTEGAGLDLLDDFRAYTALVAPELEAAGIALEPTTADSIVVLLEGGPTRVIALRGLDFPFGYVLVEPGFPESILTGVSTDEELLEEVDWYFGRDEADDGTPPRQQAGGATPWLPRPAGRGPPA